MKVLHRLYNQFDLKLLYSLKDYFYFFCFLLTVFIVSLSYQYFKYIQLTKYDYHHTTALVLNAYPKTKYQVLKIRLKENIVGYITYRGEENFKNSKISLVLNTKQIDFIDLFKPNFLNSFKIKKLTTYENKVLKYIQNQHSSIKTKEFYSAIYLGTIMPYDLRKDIQKLGISHLVAISGFHLSILGLVLYILFFYLYKSIYKRCFLHRNIYLDSMIFVSLGLFSYILYLGFIPSLFRAFAMLIFGLILFIRNIKIVSFENLFFTALFLLVLFPKLLFSLGFWFSIFGVFYIFLFLKHFKLKSKLLTLVLLNIWIYIMMIPIAHFVFSDFYTLELLSPLFSLGFNIFYPLSMIFHICNIGGILDTLLEIIFVLPSSIYVVDKFNIFYLLYVLFSLLSIFYKLALYLLLAMSMYYIISVFV
ncbi:MAG: Competence protein [uncultured Campylobacterales bacterium]|uniref:Competence protein n=1 Tax=uncultured Campylobacterales bacterium TaxID=352960 RepID=A0A6S6STE8_9BACT|nr:MAG: Competence protein [uncultured Campylobacterales bacterium]